VTPRWASLAEARDQAARVVVLLATSRGPEDWRSWVLHVSDDLGDEILAMTFAFVLGKRH
jgi:hypothetical protein